MEVLDEALLDDEVELLDEAPLDDELEELVDEDAPSRDAAWSLLPGFAGFPCADAPVTTTATSDATRASVRTSFRKAISSPWMENARSVDPLNGRNIGPYC